MFGPFGVLCSDVWTIVFSYVSFPTLRDVCHRLNRSIGRMAMQAMDRQRYRVTLPLKPPIDVDVKLVRSKRDVGFIGLKHTHLFFFLPCNFTLYGRYCMCPTKRWDCRNLRETRKDDCMFRFTYKIGTMHIVTSCISENNLRSFDVRIDRWAILVFV